MFDREGLLTADAPYPQDVILDCGARDAKADDHEVVIELQHGVADGRNRFTVPTGQVVKE